MATPDEKDYVLSRAVLLTEGYEGLLAVNGGGAAALLAFISQVADKSPKLAQFSLVGIAFMATGLVFAMLVPFFRYFHSHKAQTREQTGQTGNKKTSFWYLYTACEFLSVIAFVAAVAYLVLNALPVVSEVPIKKC